MCEARGGGWITLYLTKRVIQGRARFLIHAKALRASRGLGGSQACILLLLSCFSRLGEALPLACSLHSPGEEPGAGGGGVCPLSAIISTENLEPLSRSGNDCRAIQGEADPSREV